MEQQSPAPAQFALNGPAGTSLVLRSGKKQGTLIVRSSRSAPLAGSCSFTTRAASGVMGQRIVLKGGPRTLPFASLTVSVSKKDSKKDSKKIEEAPKKRKRTPKEIWDTAVKSALRGGLPGMCAKSPEVASRRQRSQTCCVPCMQP